MPSSSDTDTPSHTLQYSICFIVILVVIFTNLSLPTINPHCIYPIANQKTFASLLVKLVLKIADVDDMLPPKTIILTLVSVP